MGLVVHTVVHTLYVQLYIYIYVHCTIGRSDIQVFPEKNGETHHASAMRSVQKDPEGCLIATKLRGSSCQFRFGHSYIVGFHSVLSQPDHENAK